MVFESLHMPSERGYNRMRHLSRTPPEFWSRHDRYYAGWDRSKYIRARNKEYMRYGGTGIPESARRRFHARFPGGLGYYFPYAAPLSPRDRLNFRDTVDVQRHEFKFWQDFENGVYGDPAWFEAPWNDFCARHHILDPNDEAHGDTFRSFVEDMTGRGVEGPLGWGFRGDRPNNIGLWDPFTGETWRDPWRYNRDGRRHGPFFRPGTRLWQGDLQPEDFLGH